MRRALLILTAAVAVIAPTLALPADAEAQKVVSTKMGGGGSPHETVEYKVGGATVTIIYGRPYMKGRSLETLAPTGKVYRTGADEATTLTTDKPLQIGTLAVPAGTYTLYTIPTGGTWHLVISKKTGQWGVPYPKGEDLGRVPMTLGKAPTAAEMLTITVQDTAAGGTIHVDWGTTRASIPFTVG